jgi:sarcosine oxidase delta subunit
MKHTEPKRTSRFILCPYCDSRSKKLSSYFGGIQVRKCQKGHRFEIDTFMGMRSYLPG